MLLFNCIAKIHDISDICKYSNIFFRIFFYERPGYRNTVLHDMRNTSCMLTVYPAHQNKKPCNAGRRHRAGYNIYLLSKSARLNPGCHCPDVSDLFKHGLPPLLLLLLVCFEAAVRLAELSAHRDIHRLADSFS